MYWRLGTCNASWLSNFEKLKIKFPNTPKQGTLILLASFVKNSANLSSTIVYKIIDFFCFLQVSNILDTWFSVLVNEK